jgi:hypothetical protein
MNTKEFHYCIPQFMHLQYQKHKKHYIATQRQLLRPLHFNNQSFRLKNMLISADSTLPPLLTIDALHKVL